MRLTVVWKKMLTPEKFRGRQRLPNGYLLVEKSQYVIFDLETTGLLTNQCEITQLAACKADSSEPPFSQYVLPTCDICLDASEITGLTIVTNADGSRSLTKDNKLLDAVAAQAMLNAFLEWLPTSSVLCAHNAKSFDVRVIVQALKRCSLLDAAQEKIAGFVDTLPLLREKRPTATSHTLGALHQCLFDEPIAGAHDASGDVRALRRILQHENFSPHAFVKHSTTFDGAVVHLAVSTKQKMHERKLKEHLCVEPSPVISAYMAKKIATSGLSFDHLQLAFSRNKERGIKILLGEMGEDGKARVTTSKKIIQSLQEFFSKHTK